MKRIFLVAICIAVGLSFGACKQKPKEPEVAGHGMPGTGVPVEKGEKKVVVPDSVKGKWSSVVITLTDKATKKSEDVTVKLNSEYTIPNTNIKLKIGDFLPDFTMQGPNITSLSNDPKNPAVAVQVFDGDQKVFSGWLWSNFPSMHPFQHEKYELVLKEGVKAS